VSTLAHLSDRIAIDFEVCIGMGLLRFKDLLYGDWTDGIFSISLIV
jgi:hypothetical protein